MYDFFPWEPTKYGLAIAEMDHQHEAIIHVMNRLATRNAARASKEELSTLLLKLSSCALQHFADEEAYMASNAYPKLDAHKRMHTELITQLQGHVEAFEAGTSSRLEAKFFGFLKFWLLADIQGIDRQYAEHTRGRSE